MNNNPQRSLPQWLAVMFLVLCTIGFLDAAYLTVTHYSNQGTACIITEKCDQVLASQYATLMFNIPVALAGVAYYGALLVLIIMYLRKKDPEPALLAARGTAIGLLASLWFMYIQIFVIKALCAYCIFSALTSTALFAIGIFVIVRERARTTAKIEIPS